MQITFGFIETKYMSLLGIFWSQKKNWRIFRTVHLCAVEYDKVRDIGLSGRSARCQNNKNISITPHLAAADSLFRLVLSGVSVFCLYCVWWSIRAAYFSFYQLYPLLRFITAPIQVQQRTVIFPPCVGRRLRQLSRLVPMAVLRWVWSLLLYIIIRNWRPIAVMYNSKELAPW